MPITLKCDRCTEEQEYTAAKGWTGKRGTGFNYQDIGGKRYLLCAACLDKHDHLVRVINEKHQEEKQKSLELWLNSKHYG